MMMEMRPHQPAPFHRREIPEERMWILRYSLGSGLRELLDRRKNSLLLLIEDLLIGDDKMLISGHAVLPGFVAEQFFLRDAPEKHPDESSLKLELSRCRLQC